MVKNACEKIIKVRQLGIQPYQSVYDAMHQFTDMRDDQTLDELWLLEHESVFTQGKAGRSEHVFNTGDIAVVQSDRGGQVTYHGPGQQIMYVMMDLRRAHIGPHSLVRALERTALQTLACFDIRGAVNPKAPGVYVDGRKICSLGLCVLRGCSLHGLSLNVDMDLEPFHRINPCGYAGMEMVQLRDFVSNVIIEDVQTILVEKFCYEMGFLPQF